jgi:hypothetical protein
MTPPLPRRSMAARKVPECGTDLAAEDDLHVCGRPMPYFAGRPMPWFAGNQCIDEAGVR